MAAGLPDDDLTARREPIPAHIPHSHNMLFKIDYSNRTPSGDVIGRGFFIEADCLQQAQRFAQERCRADEHVESVRRFSRGEVA